MNRKPDRVKHKQWRKSNYEKACVLNIDSPDKVIDEQKLEKLYFILLAASSTLHTDSIKSERFRKLLELRNEMGADSVLVNYWDDAYEVFHVGPWQFFEDIEGYESNTDPKVYEWREPGWRGG